MSMILIAILAFIIAIGVLVTFHEFGHFWVARKLGVKVLKFSVGFGRRLFSWQDKAGTEYVIAMLPLGGYVKMLDEREGNVAEADLPHAFNRKPVWVRFSIVAAGPIFNFIFAIFAFWLMFMIGLTGTIPVVGEVQPQSIAAQSGLQVGDQILAVDSIETRTWASVFKQIMSRLGDTDYLHFDVKTASGDNKAVSLNLQNWAISREKPDLLDSLGIEAYHTPIPPVIYSVMPDEPAEKAGFLPGDEIVSVDGRPISNWSEFTEVIEKSPQQPISLVIKRQDSHKTIVFAPRMNIGANGKQIGFAGLKVKVPELSDEYKWVERFDPWHAMIESFQKTGQFISVTLKLIGKMIVGDVGLYNLSGPITLAQGAGISVLIGFQQYLNYLALISISLGVLNLLPIPILDGGHLLYYVIEIFTGKPVSEKVQIFGYKLGMLLLIFLITVAFYNDLLRMFA